MIADEFYCLRCARRRNVWEVTCPACGLPWEAVFPEQRCGAHVQLTPSREHVVAGPLEASATSHDSSIMPKPGQRNVRNRERSRTDLRPLCDQDGAPVAQWIERRPEPGLDGAISG